MSFLSGFRSQSRWMVVGFCNVLVVSLCLQWSGAQVHGQDAAPAAAKPAVGNYMPAADLLPDTTAGFARIPSMPVFCDSWREMHIGHLIDDPAMQEFIDAQKARAENYLNSIDNKIGLRPKDLFEIASGEVVVAWLPFEKDKRRPYSLCVVADVRGNAQKTATIADQIDKDLKAGGAQRTDEKYRDQEIRVYTTKPKPGQLKVEQIAIMHNDVRMIAADRDTVVKDLLDAIAGSPKGSAISRNPDFKKIIADATADVAKTANDDGKVCLEWFAKPFQMGRIMREVFEVDRGNQVDILKLLEGQGFAVIRALGGIGVLNGKKFDLLHRGHVLANRPFQKAARMLDFFDAPREPIPNWVHENTASLNRLNWKMEQAFWASETLINDALDDEIFRDMIDGIRDDEEGPQIDLAKNFLPHLDDHALLITDNTKPIDVDSERMLIAIRLKDAAAVKRVIRKAMEVEPDATELKVLPDVEIWQFEQGEFEDDLDDQLSEFGFDEEVDEEGGKPLLDHWVIAVVEKGPGSKVPYLMFSSDPELLIESAKRIRAGGKAGSMATLPEVQKVVAAAKELGGDPVAMDRIVQLKLSLRAKYELLRKGKLKESDSMLSEVFRRMVKDEDGGQPDPLNAQKLPPIEKIEKHLPDGGAFVTETNDGWSLTGFFLK